MAGKVQGTSVQVGLVAVAMLTSVEEVWQALVQVLGAQQHLVVMRKGKKRVARQGSQLGHLLGEHVAVVLVPGEQAEDLQKVPGEQAEDLQKTQLVGAAVCRALWSGQRSLHLGYQHPSHLSCSTCMPPVPSHAAQEAGALEPRQMQGLGGANA
jgi:hypothetical protein